jgi:hypothetical protein
VRDIQPGNTLVSGSTKMALPTFADIIFRTAGFNRSDTARQQWDRPPSGWHSYRMWIIPFSAPTSFSSMPPAASKV